MKKKLFVALSFIAFTCLIFMACNKDELDGISVSSRQDQGTGNNPDNTSAGTNGGATTASTVGSTSTTGNTFGSTSSGATTAGSTTSSSTTSSSTTSSSTTSSSTTSSSTTGSTTSPPASSWFKINSTLYNCSTVWGGTYNNSWSILAATSNADTCAVSFASIPSAGTYTIVFNLLAQPLAANECMVVHGNSVSAYMANSGTVTVSVVGSGRRVVYNLGDCLDLADFSTVSLSADVTSP
jgi:hypothetical protein